MNNSLLVLLAPLAVTSLLTYRPSLSATTGADIAAAEAAVRTADADWAAAASTASVDAWMAFYSADAIVMAPNVQLASDQALARRTVTELLALPHLSIGWHPIKVEVATSGDLAYLIGAYELRFDDSHGVPVSDQGKLLEIWKKQYDGSWKCVVDTWNSDGPTAAPAQAAPPASGPSTPAQVLAGDYGDMPTRYENEIRQYFQKYLRDPESVQYQEITKPDKGYVATLTGVILAHQTHRLGWTVKATINAKNSQGRYVGFKTYTFLFNGEKIVSTVSPLTGDEMR